MATITKNATDEIRIIRKPYKGHEYIDVRLYRIFDGSDEAQPTPKGLILTPDLWAEILPHIQSEI